MRSQLTISDAAGNLDRFLQKKQFDKVCLISDQNTAEHCTPAIAGVLKDKESISIVLDPGESSKDLETAENVWKIFIEQGVGRNSVVVNIGGGVVTDIGGFVASLYKRGLAFVHLPTSLLAQVDASIGGKTAINLSHIKNVIGNISFPEIIILDPFFLATLPEREMVNGVSEILKHSLLDSVEHFNRITGIKDIAEFGNEEIIKMSSEFKISIVEKDPYESSLRKQLNLGHTFGHAIEAFFLRDNKAISHGEAVAAGILIEIWISKRLSGFPNDKFNQLVDFVSHFFTKLPFQKEDFTEVYNLMLQDKKNISNEIYVVLLKDTGKAVLSSIGQDELKNAFYYYCDL